MAKAPQPSKDPVTSTSIQRQIALATIRAFPAPVALLDDTFNLVGANAAWRERKVLNFSDAINSDDLSHDEKAEFRSDLNAVFAGSRDECRLRFSAGVLTQDEASLVRIRRLDDVSKTAIVILESDRGEPNAVDSSLESEADAEPALFETDLEGRIVAWSSGARELFNLNESEVMSQHASLLFAKGSFEFPDRDLVASLREGRTKEMGVRLKRGSDSFFDGQIVIDILTDSGSTRLMCEASVVSDRQRAGALRRTEERLRYALEAGSDGIWDWNIRSDRVVFTSRVSEILGSSGGSEGLHSMHIESWNGRIHSDDKDAHQKALAAHFEGLTPAFASEYRLRVEDQKFKWVLVRGRVTERDPVGSPLRMIGTITDISERKFAQDALKRSEEQYRNLFEHASDAVVLFDVENSLILDANEKAEEIFGYPVSDLKQMSIRDLHPEDQWYRLDRVLDRSEARTGMLVELDGLTRDSKRVPLESNIRLVNYGGRPVYQSFIRDISERVTLEAQLRQSQKMETVGLLAGGIAHDFNNILTAIQGYTTLLRSALAEDSEERGMADEVTRAVKRASRLTRQLLTFSRRDMPNPVRLDINAIVEETEKMLRQLIGEHINLIMVLDPDLAEVHGDSGSIEQVITNLVINAADAMPDGGVLTISTRNVSLTGDTEDRPAEADPGDYILLCIQDEGQGIQPEVMPRIFEPFFTTKGHGTGTGLGLATVYGIVKQSKGHIGVDSEPGKGTKFRIYLPRTGHPRSTESGTTKTQEVVPGNETILVVEDEPAVRRLARRFLETNGYTVIEARDAAEAMEAAQLHSGTIDLLLTDVIMPELSGPQLAKRLRERQPDLKVLYMSGYPGEFIERYGVSQREQGYLQKPFSSEALAIKTREVLDSQ